MPPGKDRRVDRTRQLLRAALFSLIQEKAYEALSVQAIIDRANVGRATFYAHFDGKQALLLSGFDELLESLRACQRRARANPGPPEEDFFAFSKEMFTHAQAHRPIFRAIAGRPSGAVVTQQLRRVVVEAMRGELPAGGGAGRTPLSDARVQFLAGAFMSLLVWWLETSARLSVDDVDSLFRQLAVPALKASGA
jgi:AcrR family transcriptional regulator